MWKSAYVGVYQLLNWKMHGETLKFIKVNFKIPDIMSLHVFIQWCILFIHIFRIIQKISLFSMRFFQPRFCIQNNNEVCADDEGIRFFSLDFKLSPCTECCMLSFGWFPGVWNLYADVSEHSVPSSCLWRWNRQSVRNVGI